MFNYSFDPPRFFIKGRDTGVILLDKTSTGQGYCLYSTFDSFSPIWFSSKRKAVSFANKKLSLAYSFERSDFSFESVKNDVFRERQTVFDSLADS